ncbi:MAG: carboxypeptidase-like regulatory domain-containing protein, partial [Prevotella sp.]|nr:carboxypeptidase-like regulatory domain-containing protein [Prevotella sp.]
MKRIKATKRMVVILLMTMLTLNVAAQSVKDKTVTLDMTQVTVKQFFAEVKKQTGLNFIYSAELAKSFPKVTVKAQNRPVRQVLNEVMNKINCTYDVEGNIVTVTRKISGARTRTVSGTVKDESGDPLPGVSICIDDSKVCTITDINGFYTLKVPANACDLKYSFVGMDNAVVHLRQGNGHMNQDVTMTSSAQLDEVVVTGYQEISRPKMTGSVTTINADALTERYTGDIVSNLEGRVAGLSTYGGELKVRGTSSLYAESSPLLVVDGLPMEGRLEDLNQYDIQSINVLKDAAATAIYGARATNGV